MTGQAHDLPRPSLAVALDVPDLAQAVDLARRVRDSADMFKVGLELLWGAGLAALEEVAALGRPVFADTKLDDIPRTAQAAAANLARLPVAMFTVHTSGGVDMCAAALEGAAGAAGPDRPRPLVVGVTVLTSHDRAVLTETGVDAAVADVIRRRVELAAVAGLDGIVCAPSDLALIAGVHPDLIRVTPGVRPASAMAPGGGAGRSGGDDQRRVATPEAALDAGADVLVVGRPITMASDSAAAAAEFSARVIARREIAG